MWYKALIIALLSFGSSLHASPLSSLTLLGQGQVHYGFWTLMDVQLYSEQVPYQPHRWPQALVINSRQEISRSQLLKRSQSFWPSHFSAEQVQTWQQQLASFWPDLHKGDRVVAKADGQRLQFFLNQRLLGELSDPQAMQAFFDGWLAPDCANPKLRAALVLSEKI